MRSLYLPLQLLTLALLLSLIAPLTTKAQYFGPGGDSYNTIAAAVREDRSTDQVRLKGYIKEKIGNQLYRFVDDTGQITAQIDDSMFETMISDTTLVEIHGELETFTLTEPQIDVDAIMVVPQIDETIN